VKGQPGIFVTWHPIKAAFESFFVAVHQLSCKRIIHRVDLLILIVMKALLLLGCPEVPVQTGLALYIGNALKVQGFEVICAGTPSAVNLMKVADPQKTYIDSYLNIDKCIDQIAEGTFDVDLMFGFIHKDSGLQYLGTVAALSSSTPIAVVFGREAEMLSKEIGESLDDVVVIWATAVHNPLPLKKKLDKIGQWAALLRG
jgi:hypothetical protein